MTFRAGDLIRRQKTGIRTEYWHWLVFEYDIRRECFLVYNLEFKTHGWVAFDVINEYELAVRPE